MTNVLAPFGLLAFLALAADEGWRYLERDDGTARELADGSAGFGTFGPRASGGRVPAPVVLAEIPEGRLCLFLHRTRRYRGDARLWTVGLQEAARTLGPDGVIEPCAVRYGRRVGVVPTVPMGDRDFEAIFRVRSNDPDAARAGLSAPVRAFLSGVAGRLARPAEVRIRGRRLAVAWAERNAEARDAGELRQLVDVAVGLARRLT